MCMFYNNREVPFFQWYINLMNLRNQAAILPVQEKICIKCLV